MAAKSLVMRASRGNLYTDASAIPHRRVALVLGCPKRVPGGWSNPFFENRMAAAAELYHQRKIDFLVVSGDNHTQGYDEPTDMKEALVQLGRLPRAVVRPPLAKLDRAEVARIREALIESGFVDEMTSSSAA